MNFLLDEFSKSPEYSVIKNCVEDKLPCAVSGTSHIHKAVSAAAYAKKENKKLLLITADESECLRFFEDFEALSLRPVVFLQRDFTFHSISVYSHEYEHKRIAALVKILSGDFDIVLASADAAVQLTIPQELLKENSVELKTGQTLDIDGFTKKLIDFGYTFCETVEGSGQFAKRGGIIDVFSPQYSGPVRIDLWGDEIDKISQIDTISQRSVTALESAVICPACEVLIKNKEILVEKIDRKLSSGKKTSEKLIKTLNSDKDSLNNGTFSTPDRYINCVSEPRTTLFDYMKGCPLFISESQNIAEKLRAFYWQAEEDTKDLLENGIIVPEFADYYIKNYEFYAHLQNFRTIYLENFSRSSYETEVKTVPTFNFQQSSFWSGSASVLAEDLKTMGKNAKCAVLAGGKKAAQVINRELNEMGISSVFCEEPKELKKGVTVTAGGLSAGFYIPSVGLNVITQGRTKTAEKKKKIKRKDAVAYNSLDELQKGDYVVHAAHGIGVFVGINSMTVQGIKKDYIKIKYAAGDVLYVPVTQLDLVSKYIGAKEDGSVKIHKLGGSEWSKTKTRVRKAVKDMAKQLTVLYAKRMSAKGFAFSPDTDLQSDFESRFEFEETDDQLRCAAEIKGDMERPIPMDRLLCGDVGFGKTEVALRAAFKCVADGKQCAILVPTTILAWQHYNTALNRLGNMPVSVEMLSRFRTKKQQTDILRRIKSGEVDIAVGTHRLISSDVSFRDLGLVIVDEEQRFGVGQKEKLKELFPSVDVLTLTATPIPRTLNMAMTGLRDMSVIEEAPEDRHPVQTYVLEQDNGILFEAIGKELRRGGQVYYLHNRTESIEATAVRLKMRFPDYNVATAHGKMDENTLSKVWQKLLEHEIDILVCTTIIETGVDVPNANTLIIEDADRMGLSQLHQLRGRVGRSSRRAYAYLCFKGKKALSDIATKRLAAIREYTEFGSGFKIAMRDLEIRGAGSILGGEQHGNMEAVGYDMYLKLLADAVSEEKGIEPQPNKEDCLVDIPCAANIPENYIESTSQRLGIYRRIADIKSEEDKQDVIDELIDRFSEPPQCVINLCDIALLRTRAARLKIKEIGQRQQSVLIYISDINSKTTAKLLKEFRTRALLNAGARPYVAIKTEKDDSPIIAIGKILDAMEK